MCRGQFKNTISFDIMLLYVLNIFRKESAKFGSLRFIYSTKVDESGIDGSDDIRPVSGCNLGLYTNSSKLILKSVILQGTTYHSYSLQISFK